MISFLDILEYPYWKLNITGGLIIITKTFNLKTFILSKRYSLYYYPLYNNKLQLYPFHIFDSWSNQFCAKEVNFEKLLK